MTMYSLKSDCFSCIDNEQDVQTLLLDMLPGSRERGPDGKVVLHSIFLASSYCISFMIIILCYQYDARNLEYMTSHDTSMYWHTYTSHMYNDMHEEHCR